MEKLSKSICVKNNEGNFPPKIHNIVYLLEKVSISLEPSRKDFLLMINDFQLEGRYPDYKQKIFDVCTKDRTKDLLREVNNIKEWLITKI